MSESFSVITWYVIFWRILVHTLFVFGLVQSASKAVQFTSFKHCFWHSINEKFASRFGLIIIILFPGFSAKLSLIFQSPAIQPKVDWLSIVSQKGTFYIGLIVWYDSYLQLIYHNQTHLSHHNNPLSRHKSLFLICTIIWNK